MLIIDQVHVKSGPEDNCHRLNILTYKKFKTHLLRYQTSQILTSMSVQLPSDLWKQKCVCQDLGSEVVDYLFLFYCSSAVRLAYETIDATTDGEKLPPLVILHGLFGSKQNWRTMAKLFHKETGRQVTIATFSVKTFRPFCLQWLTTEIRVGSVNTS